MSGLTISMSKGKIAFAHDFRTEEYVLQEQAHGRMKNIDPSKTHLNKDLLVEFEKERGGKTESCKSLEEEFNKTFAKEVKEYNDKQSRDDRKITNYYKHIKAQANGTNNNNLKVAYEYVLQFGNRDNDWDLQKKLIIEATNKILSNDELRKYYHVNYATLHVDETEGSPHVHFNITPRAYGCKRSLTVQPKMNTAAQQLLNLKSRNFGYQKFIDHVKDNEMESVLKKHNIERIYTKEDRAHSTVAEYKKIKEAEGVLAEKKVKLSQLKATSPKRKKDCSNYNPLSMRKLKSAKANLNSTRQQKLKLMH